MNTEDIQTYINDVRTHMRNVKYEIDQLQKVVFNQNYRNATKVCNDRGHREKGWQYVGCHGEAMECTICKEKVEL